ncbi:MAG: hypothetical protein U0528_07960 [Anaerolineae bacterium]|nr:hypothetical protein [Anaerolineae bacterium]
MNGTPTGTGTGTNSSRLEYDLGNDVRALEAMANGLVPYVYEDELYGVMPGNLPRLTVGGLLMRLHRLSALKDQLSPAQRDIVEAAQKKVDDAREQWHVAYTGKIKREFKARVEAIEQYLTECVESVRGCAENYPSSMEKRVIVEQLFQEAVALDELSDDMKKRLPQLDNGIRRFAEPGEFRWDHRLEAVYPRDTYWFLYSTVKAA